MITRTYHKMLIILLLSLFLASCGLIPGEENEETKANRVEEVTSDTTPPLVSSTNPTNNAIHVAVNTAITVTFSESMNAGTISTSTFLVKKGTTAVIGVVVSGGTTATLAPSGFLEFNTTYTATITTGVKDVAGNALATPYSWSFTTATAQDTTTPTTTTPPTTTFDTKDCENFVETFESHAVPSMCLCSACPFLVGHNPLN